MPIRTTLRELEVFIAIAEEGSATKAADRVALSQSAASQALDKLESCLHVKLFDRTGRRLEINEEGRLLLPKARALIQSAKDLEAMFQGDSVFLCVSASSTIANYVLLQHVAEFRESYPNARLDLRVGNTQEVADAVASFRVDFGFIEGPCHHPELIVKPWLEDELVVFTGKNSPYAQGEVSLEALANAPWLLREQGSGTREEVERVLTPHLGSMNVEMELGHSLAIKHAVIAGMGVSCLSRFVIQEYLDRGDMVEVQAGLPKMHRMFQFIMHRDKALTRGMRAFLGFFDALGAGLSLATLEKTK